MRDINTTLLIVLLGMMVGHVLGASHKHREVTERLDRIERWMKAPSGSIGH